MLVEMLTGVIAGNAGRRQRSFPIRPQAFGQREASDSRRQVGRVFLRGQTANRAYRRVRAQPLQRAIEGGSGGGDEENTLAPQGGLQNNLGNKSRLARSRKALNQAYIWRGYGTRRRLTLPLIQFSIAIFQKRRIERFEILYLAVEQAEQNRTGGSSSTSGGRQLVSVENALLVRAQQRILLLYRRGAMKPVCPQGSVARG